MNDIGDECSAPARGTLSSRDNSPDNAQASSLDALLHEIQELRENLVKSEESFESFRAYYQREYSVIWAAVQEDKWRRDLLEEQLSDLTELYQNELSNLKEELASLEDKIAYRSYDTAADFHEALGACQMRLFKMEQQQQQQHESLENATVQIALENLINALLAVMAGLLMFVSTIANCVAPLIKTSVRVFFTALLSVFFFFLWRHWDVISEYVRLFIAHTEKGKK
ncbi:transmembrane and coiled-coil domains protein 1-like [Mugil cephalus]|uniref:transmembrane and coiled-coil domains protein 1-like n=1 Tax=Mugil cephalus TaxID=48193 RepID=UPI001FB76833|nr:transmembrane and coiled-coil domains protein 1-like [Mugil cephalus]